MAQQTLPPALNARPRRASTKFVHVGSGARGAAGKLRRITILRQEEPLEPHSPVPASEFLLISALLAYQAILALYAGYAFLRLVPPLEVGAEALLWVPGLGDVTLAPSYVLTAGVVAAGAVGALVHAIGSHAFHVGRETFGARWAWWHLSHPYRGALLAAVVYLVLRGGLGMVGAEGTSAPHFILALSAFAGLFTHHTLDWLGFTLTSRIDQFKKTRGGDGADPSANGGGAAHPAGPTVSLPVHAGSAPSARPANGKPK